jgi:hypothetical protein
MALAITSYQVWLSVHILAAVLWVGSGFTLTMLFARVNPQEEPKGTVKLLRDAEFLGSRIFGPLSFILLIVGFILVGKGDWDYDFWVIFGIAAWAISAATGMAFLGPTAKKMAASL